MTTERSSAATVGAERSVDGRDDMPDRSRIDGLSIDATLVVLLIGVALVIRQLALPTDGLMFDDAWVVAGASKGSLGDLPAISTNHPGFTLLLMGWAGTISDNSNLFAIGPFLVGSLLPAVTYWVLRRGGTGRAVSCASAALLLVAPNHVIYSGRIKPYVIETLVGVLLVAVLPRLAARTWRWPTALVWVGAVLVLGTLSGLTLILTAIAALVLVAHPAGDRNIRLAALAAQGLVQVVYLRWVQSNFAAGQLADDWETTYDSYIETDAGLWSIVRQVASHTARLGQELVSSGKVVGLAVAAVALAGIVHAARRSDHRVAARFLAACWFVALVGGFVRQVPYGPKVGNLYFPGGRASLWLLPGLVFGVAWAVDATVRAIGRRSRSLERPLVVAVVAGGLALAAIGLPPGRLYLPFGTQTSIDAIGAFEGSSTLTIVVNGTPTMAAEPSIDVALIADPTDLTGFRIELADPRYATLTPGVEVAAGVADLVDGVDQVVVFVGFIGLGDQALPEVEATLDQLGYRPGAEWLRGGTSFRVWIADPPAGT